MTGTRVIEHGGKTIEATELDGEWFVAIDGDEISRAFPSSTAAFDHARKKVTAANRKAAEPAELDPDVRPSADWWKGYLADVRAKEVEFYLRIHRPGGVCYPDTPETPDAA